MPKGEECSRKSGKSFCHGEVNTVTFYGVPYTLCAEHARQLQNDFKVDPDLRARMLAESVEMKIAS